MNLCYRFHSKEEVLTLRIVLDEDGDFFSRLGQLVRGLLGRRLPEVDPVVLQDLVRASKPDLN